MAIQFQMAETPAYTDFPFKNYGGADIGAGLAVGIDTSNLLGASNDAIGAVLPAADGAVVVGVTMETIPAGGTGRVRCMGPIAQTTASGAISAGAYVMATNDIGKVGCAKAAGAGKAGLGIALTGASDGDAILVMLGGAKNA